MIISDKNRGRDSTLEPSYVSRRPTTTSGSEIDEELIRQIKKNTSDISILMSLYNQLSEEQQQSKEVQDALSEALNQLLETETIQNSRLNNIEDTLSNLDQMEPIPLDIIHNLKNTFVEGEG